MSTNELVKRNVSGMQVIKTLLLMLEDNYTMAELIEKLNANEKESIFNNSVVSKYINTCRYCGIEIPKIQNKYFVAKLPFGLDLLAEDLQLLYHLQKTASKNFSDKTNNTLNDLYVRLNKFSNKEIARVENNNIKESLDLFETAIIENRSLMLMFKTKSVIICKPLSVYKEKDKHFIKVVQGERIRKIALNRITGIKLLGKIFVAEEHSEEKVIFNLTGELAYRYTLRDNEEEIDRKLPEYIQIKNYGEDRKELISRLLRYDKYCEVLSPQDFRDEMKLTINKMLANYEE